MWARSSSLVICDMSTPVAKTSVLLSASMSLARAAAAAAAAWLASESSSQTQL